MQVYEMTNENRHNENQLRAILIFLKKMLSLKFNWRLESSQKNGATHKSQMSKIKNKV